MRVRPISIRRVNTNRQGQLARASDARARLRATLEKRRRSRPDAGDTSSAKVPRLEDAAVTALLAPSDVLGLTTPVIGPTGVQVHARIAAEVENELLQAARNSATMSEASGATSSSTTNLEAASNTVPPAQGENSVATTASSTPRQAQTGAAAAQSEEERLLQASDGEQAVTDSVAYALSLIHISEPTRPY